MVADTTRRKLIAVVHADVKGYSRLMGEDDEYTVRTLASNRQEMYRQVELHGGEVRDTAGDGFLVEFPSVVQAVKFSVEFQREMGKRNAGLPPNRRMEFRIGVNIGDVIHDCGTIHGDGVNIAARLEGLADPGGICLSGAAYDHVKKRLDVGYEYLGEKSVKNIAEPIPTYRILMEAADSATPGQGLKRIKPKAIRVKAAAAVSVLLLAAAAIWFFYLHPAQTGKEVAENEAPALELPEKPSIAVLPFDNMSSDPNQEYFSDGITEDIITGLSKMPRLFVIARNSSFSFKGKPVTVQEVGRKLGVRYVLEGSVRREKDQVRITAQLIDAQTGGHLWAERYDRELKDIFALQDEITLAVIRAMRVKLTEGEQAVVWEKKGLTDNLEAYEKYLQARAHFFRLTKNGNAKALPLLEEAIRLDPSFAIAHAGLAFVHVTDAFMGWSKDPRASGRQAYVLASTAIKLDDSLDTAHYVLGFIHAFLRHHDRAVAEGKRAVELNPNGAEARLSLGCFLNWAGRPEEAIVVLKEGIRLNPMPYATYYNFLGISYWLVEKYDQAIAEYEKGLQIQPDHKLCLVNLTAAYSRAGHHEMARDTAAKLLRLYPDFTLEVWIKAIPWKDQAVVKRYIEALRTAGLK